jgi:hypothetical protein
MYIALSFGSLILLSGCMPRVPAPNLPERNETRPALWQDTSSMEEHYSLKPEPYSLESGQKDPELLGPQSTIKRSLASSEMMESTPETTTTETNDGQFVPREEAPSQKPATSAMTRSKCIDLIGKAKYDEYTKRYGSATAALRKCTILQRVQR